MNPLVRKLEEELLPEFEKVAERLRREIEDVQVTVKHSSFSFPDYEIHFYIINCNFGISGDDVDLSVDFYLQNIPRINADVCWSTGQIEAEFYENYQKPSTDYPEFSETVLKDLYEDLPRLYNSLFEALKRRKPIDE